MPVKNALPWPERLLPSILNTPLARNPQRCASDAMRAFSPSSASGSNLLNNGMMKLGTISSASTLNATRMPQTAIHQSVAEPPRGIVDGEDQRDHEGKPSPGPTSSEIGEEQRPAAAVEAEALLDRERRRHNRREARSRKKISANARRPAPASPPRRCRTSAATPDCSSAKPPPTSSAMESTAPTTSRFIPRAGLGDGVVGRLAGDRSRLIRPANAAGTASRCAATWRICRRSSQNSNRNAATIASETTIVSNGSSLPGHA